MNNTFSLKRFGYLLREIFVEKKLLFLGIATALVLYQFLLTKSLESLSLLIDYTEFRGFLAISGSVASTFILAVSLGKRYHNSAAGLRNFMLPASGFEKWLSISCIILLFLIVHGILFMAVDAILISALKNEIMVMEINDAERTKLLKEAYPYSLTGDISLANVIITLFLAGILLVGSTYFKKNKVVLTLLSVVGIVGLIFLINWGAGYLIFGDTTTIDTLFPFTSADFTFQIEGSERVNEIHLEHPKVSSRAFLVAYLTLAVLLFIIYYFRLKETEV